MTHYQFNDPDFDRPASSLSRTTIHQGMMVHVSPKNAFIAGLVGAVMTFCTIGFIVLLVIFFT